MILSVVAGTTIDPDAAHGFAAFQVIESPSIDDMSAIRAESVRHATAPLVVLAEDHAFVRPDTAERYVQVLRDPAIAVTGPAIVNANPASRTSQADMLISFSTWFAVPSGDIDSLAGHNGCYRRDVLLTFGDRLPLMLKSERVLHYELSARGLRLRIDGDARLEHANIALFGSYLNHKWIGGRIFGGIRAGSWSPAKRLAYAAAAPLVPLMRLRRILSHLRRSPADYAALMPGILPHVLIGLALHALGEAVGYLFGEGESSARKYLPLEVYRHRYMLPGEWEALQDKCP